MKRFVLALAASAAAIALAPAANAAITISYSVNGGAQTVLATDAGTPGSAGFVGNSGNYFFNVGATGAPITATAYDFLTQSLNIQNANGVAALLSVFVTETGVPALNNAPLMSAFTSNTLLNATATITSSYNATVLQTHNFAAIGNFSGINNVTAAAPVSLTTRYDINFGAGVGNFNGTANITAVPEPATWGLMLLGFGAMGGMLRTRRRTTARIRFA